MLKGHLTRVIYRRIRGQNTGLITCQRTPPPDPHQLPGDNTPLQGSLAHKIPPHPWTPQKVYVQGPMVVLGGVAVSYARVTLVLSESVAHVLTVRAS